MKIDFNLFNRRYMWYSSLFHCHNDSEFFENSLNYSLQIIRLKYTLLSFDAAAKVAEYSLTVLSPLDGSIDIDNQIIRVSQNESGAVTVVEKKDADNVGELYLESNDPAINYSGFITKNSFKLMELSFLNNDFGTVKFRIMDGELVTDENTTGTEGRVVYTDQDIEPPFNSEGYILPNIPFNNII